MRPYLWGTVSMPNCSEMLQLNDAQTPPVINIQETSLLCLQVLMLHSPRPPVDKFYSHLEALLLLIPGHGAISIIIYKLQPPGEEQSSEFFRCQSSCTVTESLDCSSHLIKQCCSQPLKHLLKQRLDLQQGARSRFRPLLFISPSPSPATTAPSSTRERVGGGRRRRGRRPGAPRSQADPATTAPSTRPPPSPSTWGLPTPRLPAAAPPVPEVGSVSSKTEKNRKKGNGENLLLTAHLGVKDRRGYRELAVLPVPWKMR